MVSASPGSQGSVREAVLQIRALRPELAILDEDLTDGSGAEVCRAIAAADPAIRCVLMTGDSDEAVLIDSVLAGAWGCLSKQDDSSELLRLIRRALTGHTAYSGRFRPALVAPLVRRGPQRADERLGTLTRQEMNAAIGLAKGLTNRQISQEMFLAEKTVKTLTSTVLRKLGMARRNTGRGVHHQGAESFGRPFIPVKPVPGSDRGGHCSTDDLHQRVPHRATHRRTRATDARRLADALTATRTGRIRSRPLPSRT